MKRRVVVTFRDMSDSDFAALVADVIEGMEENDYFPEPWFPAGETPTIVSLKADSTAFGKARTAAVDGDKGKIATRNAIRATLMTDLNKLGTYVNLKAAGNVEMLESSGFKLSKVPAPVSTTPLPAPLDLRLKHGELRGVLLAFCKAVKGAASYESQVCIGDSSIEANWKPGAFTSGCRRIELQGLTHGTDYHVRVRAINQNGPGAWSGIESLMAM